MARRRITKIRKHTFKGKEYDIKWGKIDPAYRGKGKNRGLYTVHGECDPPAERERELKINDEEGGDFETFKTCLHEGCHATNWKLSEKVIREIEENVAPFLWRIFMQGKNR